MDVSFNIQTLHRQAETALADPFIDVLREGPYVKETAAAQLALVEAVQAAKEVHHYWTGNNDFDETEWLTLVDALGAALASFCGFDSCDGSAADGGAEEGQA